MQDFAAPFEPESLPGVTVEDWRALLSAPLLQQLGSSEALLLTATEDTAGKNYHRGIFCCAVYKGMLGCLKLLVLLALLEAGTWVPVLSTCSNLCWQSIVKHNAAWV
jgi:hypothetical protein